MTEHEKIAAAIVERLSQTYQQSVEALRGALRAYLREGEKHASSGWSSWSEGGVELGIGRV